jgi:hypothetical protein
MTGWLCVLSSGTAFSYQLSAISYQLSAVSEEVGSREAGGTCCASMGYWLGASRMERGLNLEG